MEPSVSVALMVMFPELALRVTMPPLVKVTSVPVEEVNVTGEEVPEKARSVLPVAVEAIVTIPVPLNGNVVCVALAKKETKTKNDNSNFFIKYFLLLLWC